MERNRLKAKEDILFQTEELIQAISQADVERCNQARKKILENADIIFEKEEDKLNAY